MFEDAKQQIATLPKWVQLWMRWLNIIFLFGVCFASHQVTARWALAAYFISFPIGFGAFYFFRDIRITGLPHILFWVPLFFFVIQSVVHDASFHLLSVFGCWVFLLCLTIAISSVLDIKGVWEAFRAVRKAT